MIRELLLYIPLACLLFAFIYYGIRWAMEDGEEEIESAWPRRLNWMRERWTDSTGNRIEAARQGGGR